MKRSDIPSWLLTTLACGVLWLFILVMPSCVMDKALVNKNNSPHVISNSWQPDINPTRVVAVPSRFVQVASAFSPVPRTFTLSWQYYDTNLVNSLSNVMFIVMHSTSLDSPSWQSLGGTTDTVFQITTTNRMDFYRVKTYNRLTHEFSL